MSVHKISLVIFGTVLIAYWTWFVWLNHELPKNSLKWLAYSVFILSLIVIGMDLFFDKDLFSNVSTISERLKGLEDRISVLEKANCITNK